MLIKTLVSITLSCTILVGPTSQLRKEPERFLTRGIQRLLNKTDKKTIVGIKVLSLPDHKILYEKNADRTFVPASNMKFVTSEAAFHILGPQFRFTTQVVSDKPISNGKLDTLYVKGSGDPSLSIKDLEKLVRRLKSLGIKEIRGNIIVDHSCFNNQGTGPGWRTGDLHIFQKAPTSGLMVDHSCIRVRVQPARAAGRRPSVFVSPQTPAIRILNKAQTQRRAKKNGLRVLSGPNNTIIVKGTIAQRSPQ